jgi:hypothetical protein
MSYELTVAKAEGFEILTASVDEVSDPAHVETVIAQLREIGDELTESDRAVYESEVVVRAQRILDKQLELAQLKKLEVES